MAAPERIHLLCPQCVEGIDVMVYRSIDDQLPDAVNQTISGELFKYRCPHCGRIWFSGISRVVLSYPSPSARSVRPPGI